MKTALLFVMCVVGLQALTEAFPQNKPDQKLDLTYHPPPPPPAPKKPLDGSVKYGVDHSRGGGATAHVDGRQEVYNNGKTRAEVYGGYDRTFGGPGNGNWNSKVGGRVEHKWGG